VLLLCNNNNLTSASFNIAKLDGSCCDATVVAVNSKILLVVPGVVGKRLVPGVVAGKVKAEGVAEEEKAANGEEDVAEMVVVVV